MKENRPIILRKEKRIKTDFYKETQPRNGWKLEGKSIDNSTKKKNDSAGDRTQNLWFRRPAPYPLGHRVI